MRNESHRTRLTVIRDHVSRWRAAKDLSREAAALLIVEAAEQLGGVAYTRVRFEKSGDAFATAKAHADRIFRWLDDESKETNFMPPNFENAILLALPEPWRRDCITELLSPLGYRPSQIDGDESIEFNAVPVLRDLMREDSEAQQAVADLVVGADREKLERAHRELSESLEATERAKRAIEAQLAKAEESLQLVRGRAA